MDNHWLVKVPLKKMIVLGVYCEAESQPYIFQMDCPLGSVINLFRWL